MKIYHLLLFFFLSILLTSNALDAQSWYNVNLDLHFELEKSKNTSKILPVFVQGNLTKIEQEVRLAGGNYKYGLKDIASVELPANQIINFLQQDGIEKVEFYNVKGQILSDYLTANNNFDSVHQGLGNLPMPVKGKDVIVAIIDSGLETRHPDFQHSNGSTRLLSMWDQVANGCSPPSGYNYGCEFLPAQIDANTINHDADVQFGHGTRVAGMAAGNGSAVPGKYVGAAPEADIIHVNIEFQYFVNHFVDALYYIFNKATAEGKPVVVNSSVGYYSGQHDGRELSTSMIRNLLNAAPGRVLVQAAGNGGESYMHLNYPVNSDTSFTTFRYSTPEGGIGFEIIAFRSDFDNVEFALGVRDRNDHTFYGRTSFYTIADMGISSSNPIDSIVEQVYASDGTHKGRVVYYGQYAGDSYYMYCKVAPVVSSDHWEFQTTGSGEFHVWSHRTLITNSRMLEPGNVPTVADFPEMAYYQFPDFEYTIVGGWNCAEEVISVGNYNNASYLVMYDTDTLWNENSAGDRYERGALALSSSQGPTRLGLLKPDIAASGNHTFSATSLNRLASHLATGQDRLAPEGWHVLMGGTSGSAPVVTGAIACYLELFPNATHTEVRMELGNSAKVDTFVTNGYPPAPNYFWGHGKLDAFQFLSSSVVYGCTDPLALNYNMFATIDDNSCQFTSSNEELLKDKSYLTVTPNPFTTQATVYFHLNNQDNQGDLKLKLYDMTGRAIKTYSLDNKTGSIDFDRGTLDAGLYLWEISTNNKRIAYRKVVIL